MSFQFRGTASIISIAAASLPVGGCSHGGGIAQSISPATRNRRSNRWRFRAEPKRAVNPETGPRVGGLGGRNEALLVRGSINNEKVR